MPIVRHLREEVIDVRQSVEYEQWFQEIHDRNAKARINVRVRRLSLGNPGDVRSVGEGVWELRIYYGPGYRVYFTYVDSDSAILLLGGDKRTQDRDIQFARKMAQELKGKGG